MESNIESGYGRFDIAFFPLKDNWPGVVLELKAVKCCTGAKGCQGRGRNGGSSKDCHLANRRKGIFGWTHLAGGDGSLEVRYRFLREKDVVGTGLTQIT